MDVSWNGEYDRDGDPMPNDLKYSLCGKPAGRRARQRLPARLVSVLRQALAERRGHRRYGDAEGDGVRGAAASRDRIGSPVAASCDVMRFIEASDALPDVADRDALSVFETHGA
jgi:hypothetical protein